MDVVSKTSTDFESEPIEPYVPFEATAQIQSSHFFWRDQFNPCALCYCLNLFRIECRAALQVARSSQDRWTDEVRAIQGLMFESSRLRVDQQEPRSSS